MGSPTACLSLTIEDNDEDEDRRDRGLKAPGSSPEPGVPPHERDQQVPPPDWGQPCLDGEASMYPLGKHREEPMKKHDKETRWTPSFQFPLSEMQFSQRQTVPQRRLEPLRTCARPIRVGLSKRAKTSQLHRNHPYK
ncbi:hypothetical protein N1851_033320 [Merluccius polli]|uniref:RAD51 interacting motif domain-containing protein n=1 Tax=Merluccius polli TaxID=89951 RepID=A0AA47NN12_MERPO|nr:hypothetical protein N1851_033320 [Merluccius polli]